MELPGQVTGPRKRPKVVEKKSMPAIWPRATIVALFGC
jgi:hypothetical protein